MVPALLLVGVGQSRRVWIPLPVFLLWPFWLLGWMVWTVFRLFAIPWEKPLRFALLLGMHMSGVRVDIDTNDGTNIHVRMI
jgi:hypothetical protein